jgi:hypothetical protein
MRRRSFTKSFLFIAVLSLGATSVPFGVTPAASQPASEWKPAPPPDIYDANAGPNAVRRWDEYKDVCTTPEQLDCFESVSAFIGGQWVKGIATSNAREFQIAGLVNEDGRDLVQIQNAINYTGNVLHQINVYASKYVDSRVPWESGETNCSHVSVDGKCYREGHLQKGVKIKVSYRSSWVLPTVLSAKLTEYKTTVEKLAQSGATRVTVEGIPEYFMGVNLKDPTKLTDPKGKGSWDIEHFSISMMDGRFLLRIRNCLEKETFTVAENGFGHSVPSLANNELDLKIGAPHFRPDGKTEHIGYYSASVPLDTARCLWGNDVANVSQFKVEVFESSTGEAKTATSSISVEGDVLRINATGFTFSEPTIRVKYTPASAPAVAAPAVTTAPAVAPAVARAPKPKGVKVSLKKGAVSTTFKRATGTTYTAVATIKGSRKALKCSAKKTTVTCAAKGLKKGQWKLTITPSVKKVKGTSYVKTVRIK